jgi:hypothetical protein
MKASNLLIRWIKQFPKVVIGFITLITGIVGFIILFRDNLHLIIVVISSLFFITVWLISFYVSFVKTPPH